MDEQQRSQFRMTISSRCNQSCHSIRHVVAILRRFHVQQSTYQRIALGQSPLSDNLRFKAEAGPSLNSGASMPDAVGFSFTPRPRLCALASEAILVVSAATELEQHEADCLTVSLFVHDADGRFDQARAPGCRHRCRSHQTRRSRRQNPVMRAPLRHSQHASSALMVGLLVCSALTRFLRFGWHVGGR